MAGYLIFRIFGFLLFLADECEGHCFEKRLRFEMDLEVVGNDEVFEARRRGTTPEGSKGRCGTRKPWEARLCPLVVSTGRLREEMWPQGSVRSWLNRFI